MTLNHKLLILDLIISEEKLKLRKGKIRILSPLTNYSILINMIKNLKIHSHVIQKMKN